VYLPAGHTRQLPAGWPDSGWKRPPAHPAQAAVPAGVAVPAGHSPHVLAFMNLPAGQAAVAASSHSTCPAVPWNFPGGHASHDAWPARLWNVAAGQGAHAAAPAAGWCEPTAQAPQAARTPAAAAAVPARHGAQPWQMHCCVALQGAVLLASVFQTRTPSV
jgi:hypothetical protein